LGAARRKFYDVFEVTRSPIAEQALPRIGELYRIEAVITGHTAEARWPRGGNATCRSSTHCATG